jgi:hypothetical protein
MQVTPFLAFAVLMLFSAPAVSSGAVNPIGGVDLVLVLGVSIIFIAAQVFCTIKNITYKNSKSSLVRMLGIWSAPMFWIFLFLRETYYVNEFIYRTSIVPVALLFLAPFVCWLILRRELDVHPNKRMQTDHQKAAPFDGG